MPHADPALLAQLNASSERYRDPLSEVDWSQLSLDEDWLPPELISLAGLPAFEALPAANRRRLSQYEFLYFLHAGLWLEGVFMARLAHGLRRTTSADEYAAHLHEIREEAGHSLMFLKLMQHSGLHLPTKVFRPPRLGNFLGRHAPLNSALFWLTVTLGENLPDQFNRRIRAADEAINPAVRRMCALHMMDEARHLARAHDVLEHALKRRSPLQKTLLSQAAAVLLRQLAHTLFLPPPLIYELAGLAPGKRWCQAARANPDRREFMRRCMAHSLQTLQTQGLKLPPCR